MVLKLEQATKKRRGGRTSQTQSHASPPQWIQQTLEIFSTLDTAPPPSKPVVPPSSMSLRERHKPSGLTPAPEPRRQPAQEGRLVKNKVNLKPPQRVHPDEVDAGADAVGGLSLSNNLSEERGAAEEEQGAVQKKLPRVILKLGPHESASRM